MLNANTEGNLAHGGGGAQGGATVTGDYYALKTCTRERLPR